MSFFPLDELRCGPLKPRKHPQTTVGTPNALWGYRLQERSNCRKLPLPESFVGFEQQKAREYEHASKIFDFEQHTNRRIKRKKVWQRVQQGLASYEDTVNARRQKLRELLLKEEMGLIHEVIYQAQHGDDARMDDIRLRVEEIRKEEEEERLAVVAAKRMQQYLDECPEIREKLTRRSAIETKLGNLAQMADNEAKRQAERELDHLWHELTLKELEAKKEREAEDAKRRCLAQRDNMSILAKQVAGKLVLEERKKQVREEDRAHLERLWETLREEERKKLGMEHRKREQIKKELQEQILIAKRKLAEQARHETEMERLRHAIVAEELAKEQSNVKEASAALREELLAYLEYLEELRKEEARRDLEVDRIVEQSTKDADSRRALAVKKFREVRERLLQDVLRGRAEQLRTKSEREKRETEERELEKEMMEKHVESEAKLAAHARKEEKARALRYRKDLEEQWKRSEDARRREAEDDKRLRLQREKEDEEYQKLTEELLVASENVTPHPFKILLKECAARYAAEKAGRCYCPPPLAEE